MTDNAHNLDLAIRCETLREYCQQLDALSLDYLRAEGVGIVVGSYIYQAILKLKAAIQTMEAEMRQ